ncbi:hypothetical protein CKC_04560 [Candidatus Liberibacter solanacearum CLso-ZC1]|uniref:Uncharacterized protein n=1 Tax=Liberibacter solanacearum (strain CLso-ZC1) TaxID=658172 RepID=E4UDI3_LIBSC|nr:hypothetical protein CKC_04560 [Candidatus Liberibacter solanacearum CLso-ZC1]
MSSVEEEDPGEEEFSVIEVSSVEEEDSGEDNSCNFFVALFILSAASWIFFIRLVFHSLREVVY